jgi:VanZ family protein
MIQKNIYSILVASIIMYLSLTSAHTFDKIPLINIPEIDKIVHFVMYFSLMSVIILEHRKTIKSNSRLFLTGLIPLLYGILIEVLQATVTTTRSASVYDALANTAGIFASVLIWLWIRPFKKEISDSN